jgi:hypothetical protein
MDNFHDDASFAPDEVIRFAYKPGTKRGSELDLIADAIIQTIQRANRKWLPGQQFIA